MLREAAEDLAEWTKGTLIYLDKADPEDLGRLVAYLQLTCGIAGWISRNHY
jgi:glucose-6-phosphate isomerase